MTLAATPKAFTSHICKGKWRFEKRKMSGNAVNTKSSQLKCGCQFSTQLLTIAATSSGTAPEKHASAMSVARTSSGDQPRTLCALICSVSARSTASPPVKTLRTIAHDSNDLHRTDIVGNAEARFAKDLLGGGESPGHLAHSHAARESWSSASMPFPPTRTASWNEGSNTVCTSAVSGKTRLSFPSNTKGGASLGEDAEPRAAPRPNPS